MLAAATLNAADAKQLAARAYLRASYQAPTDEARLAYRRHAEQALAGQGSDGKEKRTDLSQLETEFKAELADAERWFRAVTDDESRWVMENNDADAAFAKKYYRKPRVPLPER